MVRYPEDEDRIAEELFRRDGQNIEDDIDFNNAWDRYFQGDPNAEELRRGTFEEYRRRHPQVEVVHEQAKGKDLERDRRKTAKVIVTRKQEYISRGATRVDLQGYDTKNRQTTIVKTGRVKGKVVKAKQEFITVNGKKQTRFRDKKGRFVKVKRS